MFKEATVLSKRTGFFFIQDIIDYLACGKTTFYAYFPEESNELNTLKDNLYKNRIHQKMHLRKKMSDSDSSTDTIALYKLIGNEEERKALSTSWTDNTHSVSVNVNLTSKEAAEAIKKLSE